MYVIVIRLSLAFRLTDRKPCPRIGTRSPVPIRGPSFIRLIHPRQCQARLVLILALLVRVADRARPLAFQEDQLRDALVRVDLGGQRGRVADFERDLAAPIRVRSA